MARIPMERIRQLAERNCEYAECVALRQLLADLDEARELIMQYRSDLEFMGCRGNGMHQDAVAWLEKTK